MEGVRVGRVACIFGETKANAIAYVSAFICGTIHLLPNVLPFPISITLPVTLR